MSEKPPLAIDRFLASGWPIVPPTVLRDGPAGPGMVQLWIDADESVDITRFMRRRDVDRLRHIAILDDLAGWFDRELSEPTRFTKRMLEIPFGDESPLQLTAGGRAPAVDGAFTALRIVPRRR